MDIILPDLVGYTWEEALETLEREGFKVVDALITGPRQIGILRRVIRQKLVGEAEVSLVVAYFIPSKQ